MAVQIQKFICIYYLIQECDCGTSNLKYTNKQKSWMKRHRDTPVPQKETATWRRVRVFWFDKNAFLCLLQTIQPVLFSWSYIVVIANSVNKTLFEKRTKFHRFCWGSHPNVETSLNFWTGPFLRSNEALDPVVGRSSFDEGHAL